jgi:threonine synthase
MSFVSHLACSRCRATYPAGRIHHLCTACGSPLVVEYDLERIATAVQPRDLLERPATMWRYAELLPVTGAPVTLGEGFTPLLPAPGLGERFGLPHLWIKDDGLNPTGTFKARGASAGISMAAALGVKEVGLPTAGNAGGAWAAYGAAAGITVHVAMPSDAPAANRAECAAYGANVTTVDGLIDDAAAVINEGVRQHGWYDAAGMREPYRVEGKKTFGLEIAEQMGWSMPQAIVYPTGGGIGLIGMWRAFLQMRDLGWVHGDLPRLIAVQAAGCAPVVRAILEGEEDTERWEQAETVASGLRVPMATGHRMTLRAIRDTGGTAVAVSDRQILQTMALAAAATGVLPCPEGAAAVAAVPMLREAGHLDPADRVVVINTGSALKYPREVDYPVGAA